VQPQTVVTRRLDIFGQLAPGLNQLLCFATFAGGWKEIQPRQAIAIKRQLDETMYSNRVLFSEQLFEAGRPGPGLALGLASAGGCACQPQLVSRY
jgi:hypothetical protein